MSNYIYFRRNKEEKENGEREEKGKETEHNYS